MPEPEHNPMELTDVFNLLVSSQAVTRARYTVIMECIARILAHLEDRDEEDVLHEIRQRLEAEKRSESEYLKEYMRRAANDADLDD